MKRICLLTSILCVFFLVSLPSAFAERDRHQTFSDFENMIRLNSLPNGIEQSPELYVVYQPDVLTSSNESAEFACSHGFPWEEDTRIPLIFYGNGVRKGFRSKKKASLEDITPTLGALMQVGIPETSDGKVLRDVYRYHGLTRLFHNFVNSPRAAFVFTLDQCRADYFTNPMIKPALSFARRELMGRGTSFVKARLSYAGSRTAVSHSVIGTGATPGIHGIVGNNIRVGDAFPLALNDQPRHGMNMQNLLVPTLSDVMDLQFDNRSEIISLSPYGRAALGMGGHGAAFSDSSDKDIILKLASDMGLPYTNGDNFSLPGYLTWTEAQPIRIDQWLADHYGIVLGETEWTETTVIVDNSPYAPKTGHTITGPQGRFPDGTPFTFAYPTVKPSATPPASDYQLWSETEAYPSNSYFGETMNTPFYQLWAVDMLLMTIEKEGVGMDRIPDLVYSNFKCLDKVGHRYGVNSPEIYTYLYYVDYCLRKIVSFLDKRIGRNKYLMVVCADHGAHNAYDDGILYRMDLFNAIEDRFGEGIIQNSPLDGAPFDDMIYLDRARMDESGLSQSEIADFIEDSFPDHVHRVYTMDELER